MAYNTTLTVPTVTGSHNDFSAVIICNGTRNDLPSGAFNGANEILNGGGNLRAYTDSSKTTQLPVEIVSFVTGASPQIEVWIKLPAGNPMVTAATIYIEADTVETAQPAVTNAYGRNAVWSDYFGVFHLQSLIDSTGLSNDLTSVTATARSAGIIGGDYDVTGSGQHLYTDTVSVVEDDTFVMSQWVEIDASLPLDSFIFGIANSGNAFDNYALHLTRQGSTLKVGVFDRTTSSTVDALFDIPSVSAGDRVYFSYSQSSTGTDAVAIHNGTTYTASSTRHLQGTGFNRLSIGALLDSSPETSINVFTDEARLSKAGIARSQSFVETEYDNQISATTWYSNDGWADSGGTTPVSKDYSALWNALNAIDADKTALWNALNSTQADKTSLWHALSSAQADVTIKSNVLNAIIKDETLICDLLNSVSATSTLRSDVLNAVTQDVTLLWDVLNSAQLDTTVKWSALNTILSDKTLIWNIQSSLSTVTRDYTAKWNTIAAVFNDSTMLWDALNGITSDKSVKWDVLNSIARDITLRYNSTADVTCDLSIRWDSLAATETDITLRYQILSDAITPDLSCGMITINTKTARYSIKSLTPKITVH